MEQSIYETIVRNIENGELREDFTLPGTSPADVRLGPGGSDTFLVFHADRQPLDAAGAKGMAEAVRAAAAGSFPAADALFAEWAGNHPVALHAEDLQRYVFDREDTLDLDNVWQTALAMILQSRHAECVKAGLVLLGLFGNPETEDLKTVVRQLGLYEGFTFFAATIMQDWEDRNGYLFDLARRVRHWGRVHAVRNLEPETDEIRRWLLGAGASGNVVGIYTAPLCWEKCGAADLLSGEPSPEEFRLLSALLGRLLDETELMPGISALDDAEAVLLRYLGIVPRYGLSEDDCDVILAALEWAERADAPVPAVAEAAGRILRSPRCLAVAEAAAKEGRAFRLADRLGIPFRGALLDLMKNDFENRYDDCGVLLRDDAFVGPTLDLFREKLPLSAVRSKAYDPDPAVRREAYEAEIAAYAKIEIPMAACLNGIKALRSVLRELAGRPMTGADLVAAALATPDGESRRLALRTLRAWVRASGTPLPAFSPDVVWPVRVLRAKEVLADNAELAATLLSGRTAFEDDEEVLDDALSRLSE